MPRLRDPRLLDILLLGTGDHRRQLQDLPVLGDVWTELALDRTPPPDLLIVPTWEKSAGDVAELVEVAGEKIDDKEKRNGRRVAYLNGLVVTSLELKDIIKVVLPATKWWDAIDDHWPTDSRPTPAIIDRWITAELRDLLRRRDEKEGALPKAFADDDQAQGRAHEQAKTAKDRQVARLGILLGCLLAARVENKDGAPPRRRKLPPPEAEPHDILTAAIRDLGPTRIVDAGAKAIGVIMDGYRQLFGNRPTNGIIYRVTLNRAAHVALSQSVAAIKGDAARSLFSISCRKIGWAVLDSGIDHRHPAFWDQNQVAALRTDANWKGDTEPPPFEWYPHRIKGAYNFQRIRAILGVREDDADIAEIAKIVCEWCPLPPDEVRTRLKGIAADRNAKLAVDWRKVEKLIELNLGEPAKLPAGGKTAPRPAHSHGTHVAGIIGADWRDWKDATGRIEIELQGVCPDIMLYDMRVLGSDLGDSEFAVSAALQFIRYYNEQGGHPRILGANMSLSIRHNVRNYACGRTPVCIEAEAVVASGVVVVAAAGNRGYQTFQLADSSTFEGYASSSITDPGNADGVITVGSTHRAWPHTYGVSFFSSRGPTGDGRLKPDLLAPGEKILSCTPNKGRDEMDGTSMAAPHVSGAAALLMARHDELRGRPARIKEVLCATATDLRRDRAFQGHGMVDVLRAIQSL